MVPYRRWRWSAEVCSEERRSWRSVTREQSPGDGLPVVERGEEARGRGGERAGDGGARGVLTVGERESK
jgi:hypothetical protein